MHSKNLFKYSIMLMLMLFVAPAVSNATNPTNPSSEEIVLGKKKWVGIWDYTVSDVPPEYTSGALQVSKSGRTYTVELLLDFGKIPTEAVVIKNKLLYFEVNLDGMAIEITLNRDGDSISGEAASMDGVFYMKGQRRN